MFRIFISAIVLILASSMANGQDTKKLTAEEKEIKQVIEDESKYFWGRNLKKWKSLYVHAPYTERTVATNDGVRRIKGWDEWYAEVVSFFSDSPKPLPYENVVKKYNYNFRIYGDGAWVSFDQNDDGNITLETRILEKQDNKWKIAMVHVVFDAEGTEQRAKTDTDTNMEKQ